ncbi:MAG: ABC-F family ATP-binding cassette domain-containing protein, partial [Ruminococcus sp.]|nr:ABC-F family ATP-binding cassette domain-containing protein [Ruminococcus sp.]
LAHHKNTLINIRDYSVKYPTAEEPVFTGLDLEVKRGDRIALHGGNGCGKSTLIHSILQKAGYSERGADITENGICETASGLIISYVDQDTSGIRGSISEYCDSRGLDLSMFCTILRQLNLERAQLAKKIEEFSEGQKKKVLLAASLLTPAHIYIWDEPLNYIDVFSRIQLEELLLSYEPTMLFVEHDVRFREKIATAVKEM